MWRWVWINGFWYRIWDGWNDYLNIQGPAVEPEPEETAVAAVDCSCEQPRLNEARAPEQAAGCMPSRPDQCR